MRVVRVLQRELGSVPASVGPVQQGAPGAVPWEASEWPGLWVPAWEARGRQTSREASGHPEQPVPKGRSGQRELWGTQERRQGRRTSQEGQPVPERQEPAWGPWEASQQAVLLKEPWEEPQQANRTSPGAHRTSQEPWALLAQRTQVKERVRVLRFRLHSPELERTSRKELPTDRPASRASTWRPSAS